MTNRACYRPITMVWGVSGGHRLAVVCHLVFLSLLPHTSPQTDASSRAPALEEPSDVRFNMKPNYMIYDMRSDDQDSIDSRLWGDVVLKQAAGRIGEHLRDLANDELGVTVLQVIVRLPAVCCYIASLLRPVSEIAQACK